LSLFQSPEIEVINLARTFAGTPPVHALKPCSFSIDPGDFVAICGPSGSGKSTLLGLLGLLDVPTGGEYVLGGKRTSELSDSERSTVRAFDLGFVFQSFHLMNYRTVEDNIQLGLIYQSVRQQQRRERTNHVLELVDLIDRRYALCSTLSGGEKQRVAIARALVRQPRVILCDEPTGNLDSANTHNIVELLTELNSSGQTIVMITHEEDVAAAASRRLEIVDGSVSEMK